VTGYLGLLQKTAEEPVISVFQTPNIQSPPWHCISLLREFIQETAKSLPRKKVSSNLLSRYVKLQNIDVKSYKLKNNMFKY